MVIFPRIDDPYVYLKSLNVWTKRGHRDYRLSAYLNACSILSRGKQDNFSREKIQSSLDFLKTIAQQERAREFAFLSSRLKKLGQFDGKRIEKLKQLLDCDPSTFNYVEFIRELNSVIKGLEETKRRAASFLNKEQEKYGKTRKDLNTVVLSQAHTLLNSLRQTRSVVKDNLDELIRKITIEYMNRNCQTALTNILAQSNEISTKKFAAYAIYLQSALYNFLLDRPELLNYSINRKSEIKDLEAEFQAIYPNLEAAFNMTGAADIITSGGFQLENVLNGIEEFFDISFKKNVVKRKSQKASHTEKEIQQLFSNRDRSADEFRKLLRHIDIKAKFQANELGNFKEYSALMLKEFTNGINVGPKGGGTDTIYAGEFLIDCELKPEAAEHLYEEEEKILSDLKKLFNNTKTDAQNTETLMDALQKLNDLYNTVDGLEEAFIIHDSSKYSKTLEKGGWYRDIPGYKGREMVILNYINHLESLGNAVNIDINWLKFAALNLSGEVVGDNLKAPLEQYFTIFIGLIMFDDFELLAKNLVSTLPHNKITNIHLYHLNDMYFPSSYFLEQTYIRMTEVFNRIQSNDGFKVSIKLPDGAGILDRVNTSEPEDWEAVRDYAASSTKVSTLFATNFIALVSKMFPS